MGIEDKVVIVSGATGDLGQVVSTAFHQAGARLVLAGHSQEKADSLANTLGREQVLALGADLVKPAEAERVATAAQERFGRIDILLNLTGGFAGGQPVSETTLDLLDRMLDLNLRTTFNMCHAVLPAMIGQQWGRIVNVGSRDALAGRANYSAYAISKAGVLRLTESLAAEVKTYNISVNAILPGTIDTPANRRATPEADFSKWVQPADIADVLLFLANQNNLINGASIPVYGQT